MSLNKTATLLLFCAALAALMLVVGYIAVDHCKMQSGGWNSALHI
jgi:hypothetical protein